MTTTWFLQALWLIAVTAEAMTAALAAGRRSMDWVGVCMLGCVTALGGGSCRDVLLGRYPLTWVQHPEYLALTAAAAFATIFVARFMAKLRGIFLFLDAVGLVVFTIVGCNIAMQMNESLFIVIVAGMITGVLGGVLRDVLCNEVPLLFHAELYATVSVVTGAIYIGGLRLGIDHDLVTAAAMIVGLSLRMLALKYEWDMPKFVYKDDLY
jgi:uncharacterized membrane protein YeiH